jgi:hypothetical protein
VVRGGSRGRFGFAGDIDDVQFATSCGFCGVIFGWVMRNMVAIDDVIVPVPLALLQSIPLKLERSYPSTALLGVLGQRKLTCIIIPRAEEMHRLAAA